MKIMDCKRDKGRPTDLRVERLLRLLLLRVHPVIVVALVIVLASCSKKVDTNNETGQPQGPPPALVTPGLSGQVNQMAPDFDGILVDGRPFHLAERIGRDTV